MPPAVEPTGRLVLVRHGETEWSRSGRHTGSTDIPLTPDGERDARALGSRLAAFDLALVLASPLTRARRTAELAGLSPSVDPDLVEWDYGGYEGRTTAEIRESVADPTWTVFDDGVVPGDTPGETVEEVAARASRVLARVEEPPAHRGRRARGARPPAADPRRHVPPAGRPVRGRAAARRRGPVRARARAGRAGHPGAGTRRSAEAQPSRPAPSMTESTFPEGSVNHAMSGPPPRKTPLGSVSTSVPS